MRTPTQEELDIWFSARDTLKNEVEKAIAEAKRIAADAGLYCGVNGTNEGWDIYACDEDESGDKMDWRIDLRIAE